MDEIMVIYWSQGGNTEAMALFSSYGWGDGRWMRDWEVRMKGAGAGEGVGCHITACYPGARVL